MAVPDPHIAEMEFLSYEPKPRSCKQPYIIPRKQDYIEVMWCLDHLPGLPERWCTAEVLHISRSSAQNILADGVIRYLPGDSWDEEVHQVHFLDNYELRRIRDTSEEDDLSECLTVEGDTPVTKWQYASENMDRSAPSDDEEWIANSEGRRKRQKITERGVLSSDDGLQLEVESLRTGYASLLVEMEKIKRELSNHSQSLLTIQTSGTVMNAADTCSSAGCVLSRLRHKIGVRMQGGLRSMNSLSTAKVNTECGRDSEVKTGDGIRVGAVKTRVECTILQFESIARIVKANADPENILFVPDFSHTQLPLPCSAAFRIMFKSFIELASQIGVTSLSDILEMARKCGSTKQEDLLRILATYDFDEKDLRGEASIYLGTSCGIGVVEGSERTCDSQESKTYPVLFRSSRAWNRVDRRFSNPLQIEHRTLPALGASASDVKAFSLSWKRSIDLGPRIWSKSMTGNTSVFGTLEICLPFVQVEGESLCREIAALAGDDEWESLFNKSKISTS